METQSKIKVGTFFMDERKDVEAYEAILNNEMCHIIRRETFTLKENNKEFSDGKMVSATSTERIQYIVEYEQQDI